MPDADIAIDGGQTPSVRSGPRMADKHVHLTQRFAIKTTPVLQALLIVAAGVWVFYPAIHGQWLWDDDVLITNNLLIHDPAGLWKTWFAPTMSLIDYFPITVSVEWLAWRAWGLNTFGYHLTSIVLHLTSALLVWRLLSKLGIRLAWLGGLLFAIHPVMVESVAWIAELKNTLSLPPFLIAMCAWIDYEEHGKWTHYWLALGLFLVAMLCKTTMVMFPFVILLYAWWKRGRIRVRDLTGSAPFFVVSLVLGLTTMWFLHHAMAPQAVQLGGFLSRVACAGLSLAFYFSKSVLPIGLLPTYPQWAVGRPSLVQFLPWPILGGVLYLCWANRASWGRHALLGLGFFLINLAPFVGFTAAAYMDFTWVMDHTLYIPLIGLIGLATAGLGWLDDRVPASTRPYGIGMVTVVLVLLAVSSRAYAGLYVNPETLWTYTVERNSDAWLAYDNLGYTLTKAGKFTEAIGEFEQALRINPNYASTHDDLGTALFRVGRLREAQREVEQALRIDPDSATAHNNLATILVHLGRIPEAIQQFQAAVRINPNDAEAHNGMGTALVQNGQYADAVEEFEAALQINPDFSEVHDNLGAMLAHFGQIPEAIEQFQAAVRINPNDAEAHYDMGFALTQTGRDEDALEEFEAAVRINPDFAEAHNNLGVILARRGRIPEAIQQFQAAVQINPNYTEARRNLTRVLNREKTSPPRR